MRKQLPPDKALYDGANPMHASLIAAFEADKGLYIAAIESAFDEWMATASKDALKSAFSTPNVGKELAALRAQKELV